MVTMKNSHPAGPSLPYTVEELAAALLYQVRLDPLARALPRQPSVKAAANQQAPLSIVNEKSLNQEREIVEEEKDEKDFVRSKRNSQVYGNNYSDGNSDRGVFRMPVLGQRNNAERNPLSGDEEIEGEMNGMKRTRNV